MVLVLPPPVPVMVMAWVARVACEPTMSLRVAFPDPGAVMVAGVKLAVTPLGNPLADKATAESKPPEMVLVIVEVPDEPLATVIEPGDALRLKLGLAAAVTVKLTVVVCVVPPPTPLTVIVYVPVAVVEATAMVMVEVPEPGAAMELGLKLTVTPVGWPLADKAIAELKPPDTAVVMVDVPLFPCTTETEVGEAEMLKLGPAAAVTVKATVVVFVIESPVPLTVIVYVPVAVVEATAMVMVEVPEPGAAMEVGLKLTVTPVGWPLADKAIAELKPPETAVVMVDVPLLPCTTETEAGEAEMVKLGDDESGARALIRLAPFGLPQPVSRS